MAEDLRQRPGGPAFPAWPGIDEAAVTATCVAMARRLATAPGRTLGVLPAAGALNLGPLLVRLASALAGFADGKVGVIPRWRSWARDPGGAGDDTDGLRLRAIGPNVVAIVPKATRDSRAAALALQPALWSLPDGVVRVIVDLTGYTEAGAWPGAGVLVDGVAIAVPARAARRDRLAALLSAVPEGKLVGTIFVG